HGSLSSQAGQGVRSDRATPIFFEYLHRRAAVRSSADRTNLFVPRDLLRSTSCLPVGPIPRWRAGLETTDRGFAHRAMCSLSRKRREHQSVFDTWRQAASEWFESPEPQAPEGTARKVG